MMCASFTGNRYTTIVSYNSPTDASDKTDTIAFYNELSSFVRLILKRNVLKSSAETRMLKEAKTKITNSVYTTRQTEMKKIWIWAQVKKNPT